MFSLTPPPSEFDEFDKNALLTCSPTINEYSYPSPAPSQSPQPHQLSRGLSLTHADLSINFVDSEQPEHTDMFYSYGNSEARFLPMSTMPEQEMPTFNTTSSYPNVSQPSAWLPYATTYPQSTSMSSYDSNTASQYPPFETSMSQSYANIIPPTPQDITQATFDFNTIPRLPSNGHHLSASPAFSHQSSQPSSLSSLSRSPSPALYSMTSNTTPAPSRSTLRSNSTSSNSSLHAYGIPVADPMSHQPAWRCAYPGCTSRATFTRGCDLRKHYNRHSKHLFCRVDGCPQSQAAALSRSTDGTLSGGFSSKKDRARHEAKHNPGIKCEWTGPHGEECGRIFSRMDNMKDHVRRIHKKQEHKNAR